MKNVLYLSYDGMTDPLGQSQVLPYIKGLTKEGYRFSLISFEKPEKLKDNKALIQQICDDIGIDWHPLVYTKRPPVLSTLFDVVRLYNKAYTLHRQKAFSLVHCRSYISSLVGLSMKRKFATKFIFDMRGFWADERVDGNLWNLKNPLYKTVYNFFKKKEKAFLENADCTVSLTYAGKEEINRWQLSTNAPVPITVIPCCVDLAHFDPLSIKALEQEKYRQEWGIQKEDFVLSYLGSIGTWYLLEEMLVFFKTLQEKRPQSKFLFITGDAPSPILACAEALNIPLQYVVIQQASRQNVPIFLSLSHYSIFFIKPSYSKKASSPTKQGEIMAMNIPVVCNSGVGDTDRIVQKYNAGIVIERMDIASFQNVIKEILDSHCFNFKHLKAGAEDYFSLDKGIKQYASIYAKIL